MNKEQFKTEIKMAVDLNSLSQEDKKKLMQELKEQEKQEKAAKEKEKETYVELREDFVFRNITLLNELSLKMSKIKATIFSDARSLIQLKESAFVAKSGRRSDMFTTKDGSYSINLGCRVTEGWDDTADNGIEMVKTYLKTLANDDNSATLVDTILSLLSKDNKGTLRADKVIQLEKIAKKIDNEDFTAGITMIRDAYRPQESCRFIEARYKDIDGKMKSVPLSISAVD